MYQCGATGKMRDFWEEKLHIIVSRIGDNGAVYKVKKEDEGNSKISVTSASCYFMVERK